MHLFSHFDNTCISGDCLNSLFAMYFKGTEFPDVLQYHNLKAKLVICRLITYLSRPLLQTATFNLNNHELLFDKSWWKFKRLPVLLIPSSCTTLGSLQETVCLRVLQVEWRETGFLCCLYHERRPLIPREFHACIIRDWFLTWHTTGRMADNPSWLHALWSPFYVKMVPYKVVISIIMKEYAMF